MPKYAAHVGLRDAGEPTNEITPEQMYRGTTSVFGQGLRAGLTGAGGQMQALAGGVGEALGANDFARQRYAASALAEQQAQQQAPVINDYHQIDGLRSGGQYLAGQIGQMAPVLGAGVLGATLAPAALPAAGLIGATAATAPFMAGSSLQRQQTNPEAMKHSAGERLAIAGGEGVVDAALMNAVPQLMGGRLLGAGAGKVASKLGIAAQNTGEAVVGNAAAGAASEKLHQTTDTYFDPNRDTSKDSQRMVDAAATGAIIGAPFGAAGFIGQAARAKRPAPRVDGVPLEPGAAAPDAAKQPSIVPPAPASEPSLMSRVRDTFKEKAEPTADLKAVAEGRDIGINPEVLRTATPERQGILLGEADQARSSKVAEWAQALMGDKTLAPEDQARLSAAMTDLSARANQMTVAGLELAQHASRVIGEKAGDFAKMAEEKYSKYAADKTLSEDTGGLRGVITDVVSPILNELHPEIFKNPEAMNNLADGLRKVMAVVQESGHIDAGMTKQLTHWFGDEAPTVMAELHSAVLQGTDVKGADAYYGALSKMSDTMGAHKALTDLVRKNLPEELAKTATPEQVNATVDNIREFAAGRHTDETNKSVPKAQAEFMNKAVEAELRKTFGAKTETVLEAFNAERKSKLGETRTEVDPEQGMVEHAAEDVANSTEPVQYLGGGKDKAAPELVRSPEAHRAEFNNKGQAERVLEQAQLDNPDRIVKFTKVKDMPEEQQAKYPDAGPDDGLVTVEATRSETKLTPAEFEAMRIDPSKTSHMQNNPSRVDTGVHGATMDARAIVKAMQGKLDYAASDNISARHRVARAFTEGVAALQDHLGKSFEIPDSTVLAKGFTYGEAKRLSFREPDPAWMKGKTDAEINAELTRRDNLKDMAPRELEKSLIRAQDILAKREAALREYVNSQRADGVKLDKTDVAELRKTMGVDEARSAVTAAERETQSRDDTVRKTKNLDDAGRTEAGSDEQIHTSADHLSEKDLARRTGDDGGALSYLKEEGRKPDGSLKDSTINAIDSKVNRLENFSSNGKPNMIARRVGEKAREVFDRFGLMTKMDQAMMASIVRDGKISSISETVNDLHAKYKDMAPAKKDDAFAQRVLSKGDPAPIVKEIKGSIDTRVLQRAVDALAKHVGDKNADKVIAALNERLGELVQDPNTAYNMQRADPSVTNTSGKLQDVAAHIDKVLGKTVDTEFAKMLHEGDFTRAAQRTPAGLGRDLIRVSVHSLDPMSTAHHESLHAFFAKLRDSGLVDKVEPLLAAADSVLVKEKLRVLLEKEPAALRQVERSLEERAAYMYQFWAAGKLELGGKAQTLIGKLGDFFRKALGMWTNDARAVHIMEYFQQGEYAKDMHSRLDVTTALEKGTNPAIKKFGEMVAPLARLGNAVAATGDARMRDTRIPALIALADKAFAPNSGASHDLGYIPASRAKRSQMMNDLSERMHKYDAAAITDALEAMHNGRPASTPEGRLITREVRKTLDATFDYMREAGVKVDDLGYGKDYFPRVWDASSILSNEKAFRDMMKGYVDSGEFKGSVDKLISTLTRNDGSELQVETVRPGMNNVKERVLSFIKAPDAAPFLEKDMYRTLNGYITQATRRAEWARRFDDDGAKLHVLMDRAKQEGATPEQLQMASDYLQGVDGTLGDKLDPKLRRAFGNMMVYQNIRLLPLALFSSLIDPLGIVVRGGTAKEAFTAFKRGVTEIPKGFKKDAVHDEWTKMAEHMGVIDSSVLMHSLGSAYSQGMVSDAGRRINDTFFKYNLMEQFNTSMRVAATESAASFLARHADGASSQHSARWLAELGFKPGEIPVQNGRALLTFGEYKAAGFADAKAQDMADRVSFAVNKWVDGAILRPNAAHKPIWMNDPHYALIAHLKQFVYSFQETILKRVANEYRHGNLGPAYALASYVPFMIAADLMKGMIVGGGSQPAYKDSWDAGDYVWSGVQRAGLFGVGQFGLDAAKNVHRGGTGIGALGGPTVEQLGDAASVVGGAQQFKTFALNSLPANQLFDSASEAVSTNSLD